MKVCSQCGATNNDTARFCKGCGNNLDVVQPVAQPSQPSQPTQPVAQPAPQFTQPTQPVQPVAQPATQFTQPMQPTQPTTQFTQPLASSTPGTSSTPGYSSVTNQINADQVMNFFRWLISAIKKPSQQYHVSSLYAVLVFVISALLSSIQMYCTVLSGANMVNSFTNTGANLVSSFLNQRISAPQVQVPISVFFAAFFAAIISVYMTFVVALIGAKMFGDPMPVGQLHVQFAQKMVPIIVIQICAALLGILTLSVPSTLLQVFAIILTLLLPFSFVSHAECTRKIDREWLWVIFVLVAVVILLIVFAMSMGIFTNAVSSAIRGSLFHY